VTTYTQSHPVPWFRAQKFSGRRHDRISSFSDKYPDYDKFPSKRSLDDNYDDGLAV
jgi:hypothetical protein